MAKRKKNKKSSEDLSAENEIMKLKMMAEFGGNFVGSENIPPEIENQFLKQIISFHKQHENSALTTVYDFIGQPEYNHVNDMSEKQIGKELKRLIKLMEKNGVSLSVLAETPERDLYRFITEELFKHEIENVKVKGWVNQFIYEEFHPNSEYDIKNAVEQCLRTLFTKDALFYEEHFAEEMKDSLGLSTDIDDFRGKVESFKSSYNNVQYVSHTISALEFNDTKREARAFCEVTYKVQKEKGKKSKSETTTVELALKSSEYVTGWWEIEQVVCPLF